MSVFLMILTLAQVHSCEIITDFAQGTYRFRVATSAMAPTVEAGDIVVAYESEVFERNDLATFYSPVNEELLLFRISGLPGDSIAIQSGFVLANGQRTDSELDLKFQYYITSEALLRPEALDGLEIMRVPGNKYVGFLSDSEAKRLNPEDVVKEFRKNILSPGQQEMGTYQPFASLGWNRDQLGPYWIPKSGNMIALDERNFALYAQLITAFEDRAPQLNESYTFQNNYYFFTGDNRHNAHDSRYIGPVPESLITRKVKLDGD